VFDPFFTTKAVGKGRGLGLSVCFAIVRDHGGVIRVSRGAGGGAVFTVELPVIPAELVHSETGGASAGGSAVDEERAAAAAAPGAAGGAPLVPTGPRILIAESEPHVLDVLVELLGSLGYRADTAETGESALAKLRSQDYEALIADFEMPRLEGRSLLDILRSERPKLARRILFLASDAARPQLLEFASTSGNLLMGKPFRLEAMRDALQRLFPESRTLHRPASR